MQELIVIRREQEVEDFNIHQETAAEVIRSHGSQFEQIRGRYSDGRNGRCVIGVLASYLGWDGKDKDEITTKKYYKEINDLLGGDESIQADIVELNDKGKTFNEIADELEQVK